MERELQKDLSDRIRERAYEIWATSGYSDGEAEEHWLAAEREILSALQSAVVTKRIRSRTTPKLSRARAG